MKVCFSEHFVDDVHFPRSASNQVASAKCRIEWRLFATRKHLNGTRRARIGRADSVVELW